jgi:hypothetical protein
LRVVRRHRVIGCDEFRDVAEPAQQRDQRTLHLQHHAGATSGDHGQVARHLDRVAQPLLGMEEEHAAIHRLATPEGACGMAMGRTPLAAPAPFVAGEARFQLA